MCTTCGLWHFFPFLFISAAINFFFHLTHAHHTLVRACASACSTTLITINNNLFNTIIIYKNHNNSIDYLWENAYMTRELYNRKFSSNLLKVFNCSCRYTWYEKKKRSNWWWATHSIVSRIIGIDYIRGDLTSLFAAEKKSGWSSHDGRRELWMNTDFRFWLHRIFIHS